MKHISDEMPAEIAALVEEPGTIATDEQLMTKIRGAVSDVFVMRQQVIDLEKRTGDIKAEIKRLSTEVLPDLFDQAGIKSVEIDQAGNLPAMAVSLKPFYSASISAKWEPERRQAAFDWLEDNGHASLIKTTITVAFDKTDRMKARDLVQELREKKLPVEVNSSVHAATLTSWLKAQVEKLHKVPPLDTIGGFIGREVKIKEES